MDAAQGSQDTRSRTFLDNATTPSNKRSKYAQRKEKAAAKEEARLHECARRAGSIPITRPAFGYTNVDQQSSTSTSNTDVPYTSSSATVDPVTTVPEGHIPASQQAPITQAAGAIQPHMHQEAGISSCGHSSDSIHKFIPQHEQRDVAIMQRAMEDTCQNEGWPCIMHTSNAVALPAILFAFPDVQIEQQEAIINPKRFYMTGIALVQDSMDNTEGRCFCNCTSQNQTILCKLESLHLNPGGCSDVPDAECIHARYLRHMIKVKKVEDIEALVAQGPGQAAPLPGKHFPNVVFLCNAPSLHIS